MVLEQLGIHIGKTNKNRNEEFTPFIKINSEWVIDLNAKYKTIKYLGDNSKNPGELGFGDSFSVKTPNVQSKKEKIGKLDFIKI